MSFGDTTKYGYDRSSDFLGEKQASDTTPKKSLLQAANIKVAPVSATPISQHAVQADKNGAQAQIKPNLQATSGLKQQIQANKACITEGVRKLKADVCAATEAVGHKPGALYKDERMAANNEIGLLANLGFQLVTGIFAAKGAGSLATKGAKYGSGANLFAGDLKGSKDIKAKIAEAEDLARLSSGPDDTHADDSSSMAGQEPKSPESQTDLKGALENGYDFAYIMSLDENNPHQLPEWKQATSLEAAVGNVEGQLAYAAENTQEQIGPQNIDTKYQYDTVDVALTGQALKGISAMQVAQEHSFKSDPQAQQLVEEEERIAKAAYDREYRPPELDNNKLAISGMAAV